MGQKSKRKINIDGTEYIWAVTFKHAHQGKDDYVHLGIWCAESANLRGQKLNVKVRFDDPWLTFGTKTDIVRTDEGVQFIPRDTEKRPITPADIRSIVCTALEQGWCPQEKKAELFMRWDRDTQRLEVLTKEDYQVY